MIFQKYSFFFIRLQKLNKSAIFAVKRSIVTIRRVSYFKKREQGAICKALYAEDRDPSQTLSLFVGLALKL